MRDFYRDNAGQSYEGVQQQCHIATLWAYDLVEEYRKQHEAQYGVFDITQKYAGYFSLPQQESGQSLWVVCLPANDFQGQKSDLNTLVEVEHQLREKGINDISCRFVYAIRTNGNEYTIDRTYVDEASFNRTSSELFRLWQLNETLREGALSTIDQDMAYAARMHQEAFMRRERCIAENRTYDTAENIRDIQKLFACAVPVV